MSGHITVVRSRAVVNDGHFGKMYFTNSKGETLLVGVSMEPKWDGNKKGASCIPVGNYKLVPHNSSKYGSVVAFVNPDLQVYHWEEDIPAELKGIARSVCLIHAANWPQELRGCVAVGKAVNDFGKPKGVGINSSRPTLNTLRQLWGNREDLTAKIRWES